MQGVWIMEIPELQGFSRSDVNDIKAFISAKSDKTRLAYHQQCKAHRIAAISLFQQNTPFLISLVHSHPVILSGARPHNRGQPNYACLEPTVVRLIAMQRKAAVACLADICCFRAVLAKSSPIRRWLRMRC
jgi:hypothetical protein